MFKNTLVKSMFVLMAVSALAINTGCFSSATGPEAQPELENTVAFKPLGREDLNEDGVIDATDVLWWDLTVACDVTGDSRVDIRDAGVISGQMGQSGEGLAGDVNGDGAVTFSDLVLYAATAQYSDRADTDGNGTYNRADRNKIEHSITES